MAVDRPTFSESWYRVANLRPRLRASVQMSRQHFRGQLAYVVQDPSSNQFSRLNEPGHYFVALLDGRRTVAEVWRICNDQLGDSAPTQPEAIQLLGQLYTSNLLQAELPPDAEGLFDRYRKRRGREIQGYLSNLLFIRIPLFDPDHFLNRWVGIFGKVFTIPGLVLWLALLATGMYFLIGNWSEATSGASGVLAPDNLILLYVATWLVKVFHEFAHAFSCKQFGRKEGKGGEVHVMGVMLLVFVPLPYVDATSVWEFRRSKWHKAVVGAAGVLVELAIAAVATIVWARTSPTAVIHQICYNVMFVASVSTLIFNGNPLLRFDAYYVLSDLLEITNLWQRSREYLYYLVRRHAWGVRGVRNPANTVGERIWLSFYGVGSTIYRFFVVVRIVLFVADKLFFLGAILAVASMAAWVLAPLYKFVRYLATSNELSRKRARAVASTLLVAAGIIAGVGVLPAPDRYRAAGVVEPADLAVVYAESDGYVRSVLPYKTRVQPGEQVVRAENVELAGTLEETQHLRAKVQEQRKDALSRRDAALMRVLDRQLESIDENIRILQDRLAGLVVRARLAGTWLSPDVENMKDVLVKRGDPLGLIASVDDVMIRVVADQQFPIDKVQVGDEVSIRVLGRAELEFQGRVKEILPAGRTRLPSQALGYAAGGPIQTARDDKQGVEAVERFFEIHVTPDRTAEGKVLATDGKTEILLRSGQRVVTRFSMAESPLGAQWWRSLRQLILRRYHS